MFGNAFRLIFAADHEAGDVLEEEERDAPLLRQFDEVRALLRAFAEQHAVIGKDRDRNTPDMGKTKVIKYSLGYTKTINANVLEMAIDLTTFNELIN